MPKTEGFRIIYAQDAAITEDKANNAAGVHPQNVVRRKLADISNQQQNQRLLIQGKSQSNETTTKEYINQLQKENMALVKMLAQRNKIVEQNGIELDRLRVNLIKMQEQNQLLALSNNQMLVELNSGRDRLKMLQHELGCKTGLLKARKMDPEGRAKTTSLGDADAELIKSQEEMESSKAGIDDEKSDHETTRSLQPSGGVCPSEQFECKDKTENKRPFLRRQSARFKADDLLETNKSRVCASELPEDSVRKQGSTSESSLVKNEGSTDDGSQIGRSSLDRPSRAAAKKVQSYKEIPINVKLRRA
ncbi:Shugoshin C terminus [Perilla frutescens var. hirtella]|uniref:Shugoshin C terminus n=1 Tax=Perilla frutescens var. hirtella TaxID=608512 RepID=A0AAD4JQK9_PERFH|nr:Shugoshin C terminus [Perilla frutescens var. hirtella]